MKLQVRPVTDGDWLGVLHVEQTLRFPWDGADHREFLVPRRNGTYVACHQDHVLGFVSFTLLPDRVLVGRVGVGEAWRRKGIGYGLLDVLAHWHGTARQTRLHAAVSEYDVGSQLFLRACGWRCVHTDRWGGEIDEYTFTKEILR